VRALVPLAMEAMMTEHEADRTTSLMMSSAVQQSCELTGDILERIRMLMEGIQVFPERMRRNLDLSDGMIMGEALMLSLGHALGRQVAHDVIYDAAMAAAEGTESFRDLLARDEEVTRHLTPEQVEALLDPEAYTGTCAQFASEQAARARELAKELEKAE
jgi:3-carboxy-cis,cis-muconate cycloisomerase